MDMADRCLNLSSNTVSPRCCATLISTGESGGGTAEGAIRTGISLARNVKTCGPGRTGAYTLKVTVVAVFSDLHGNTPALQRFLSVIPHVEPDLVVNLGDIASGGVDPRGTLDVLRRNPRVITIAGNPRAATAYL